MPSNPELQLFRSARHVSMDGACSTCCGTVEKGNARTAKIRAATVLNIASSSGVKYMIPKINAETQRTQSRKAKDYPPSCFQFHLKSWHRTRGWLDGCRPDGLADSCWRGRGWRRRQKLRTNCRGGGGERGGCGRIGIGGRRRIWL